MPSSKLVSSETILALDLATKCGWAVLRGKTLLASGVWVLYRARKDEHRAQRWLGLHDALIDAVHLYQPDVLAYERIRRHMGCTAAHVYGGLLATLEQVDYLHTLPTTGMSAFELLPVEVSQWRKETTGNGAALKSDVAAFVKQHFGISPKTDDETEAIAIAEAVRRMRARTRVKKGT